ncbi:MAG: hypothetical protein K9K40_12830 [Desulfotignum sp.]|nr:hypothetical protein [Desulfotignum sp.]MCF8125286.1 hypothetical protein [Desulfotignum sp.]
MFEKKQQVHDAKTAAAGEIKLLKETVSALRNEMTHQKIKFQEKLYQIEKNDSDQIYHLHQTIIELRLLLEKTDTGCKNNQ